ncbi:pectate lyase [Segatella bryantii]|uniref:pectate lyase n=1 Tax=Segatella bryantii TaxID=77095 RepID=UPI0024312924|nr:pectate lyase [Segatella bryantii]
MKINLQTITLGALCVLSTNAFAQSATLPAFPGAEGFGMYTTGGRSASTKVYHVTTLEDNGKTSLVGSLRWANAQSGPRIIVFDVSGTIHLAAELKFNTNTTILGQTAPGEGICIADYPVQVKSNNIIRFIRFRLGNKFVAYHEGDGLGGMDNSNVIIDHCSVSWSIDECLSVYGSKNLTVQWCIAAQSLVNSGHSKGAHGYGGNWGGSGATYHHNLMAHHTSRVPRLGPRPSTQLDERMDLRNNVFYNWAGEGCYGGEGMNVNIVNNYYKPGPGTALRSTNIQKRIAGIGIRTTDYTKHGTSEANEWDKMWHVWGKFYVRGNVNASYDDVTRDNWTYGIYNQIKNSKVDNTFTQTTRDTMKLHLPIAYYPVTTETAYDAYEKVLSYAGACLHRDAVDDLIVNDTRDKKATYTGSGLNPGYINTQDDIKPAQAADDWSAWPTLVQTVPPVDTDGDGMPDAWESKNGTDPAKNDAATIADNGYTNIENYANDIVADITAAQLANGQLLQNQQEAETGITGEVTAIQGIKTLYDTSYQEDDYIYTLGGIAMGKDDSQLPKGIYIRHQKKFVVN